MTGRPAAIVTGVSRGLGAALAAELHARGFDVLGVGRSPPPAMRDGDRFVRFDLAQTATLATAVEPAFAAIAAQRPSSVLLVNNAATAERIGVIGALATDDIAMSLAINLLAPAVLANVFCRIFDDDALERRIINISSGAAESTLPGESLYCIGKAGLEMLTKSLAAERASPTFRAITIRPGIIDTPMQAFARAQTRERLPSVDLFKGFHADGQLVAPDVVARRIVERLVLAPVEHGRTYRYAEL
jgi:NAD(P)-dependent dehydrogenase (short-subunit alcohol dehydrogenase family)